MMLLSLIVAVSLTTQPEQPRPIVGAIRWDAWHGDKGEPGKAVERALGPKRWHHRLPFFGKAVSDTQVEIRGYSQDIVDKEIEYAHHAGLDYWAFVTYEPDSSMSEALRYYLSSKRKQDINFCLVTSPNNWGSRQEYREKMKRILALMSEPTYQKVLGDRPLLYVGFISENWIKAWGGFEGGRQMFADFRAAALLAGVGNPYIVVMDFNPTQGKRLCDALGADAISAYATPAQGKGAPYAELAQHAENFWERCKATGAQVVPIVMSGWDRRPRVEHPVPWETWQKPGEGIEKYYESPTPAELAAHLRRSLTWVAENAKSAPAQAVLIYAWNENDEGGWLVPTLAEKTARIDAIRKVLKSDERGD